MRQGFASHTSVCAHIARAVAAHTAPDRILATCFCNSSRRKYKKYFVSPAFRSMEGRASLPTNFIEISWISDTDLRGRMALNSGYQRYTCAFIISNVCDTTAAAPNAQENCIYFPQPLREKHARQMIARGRGRARASYREGWLGGMLLTLHTKVDSCDAPMSPPMPSNM